MDWSNSESPPKSVFDIVEILLLTEKADYGLVLAPLVLAAMTVFCR